MRSGETRETSLILKQVGEKVTGLLKTPRGETEIQDGKVKGDELSFVTKRETQRGSMTATYQGKIAGDTIKGTATTTFGDRSREREWTAKRAAVDPTGAWSWSMERDDGQVWEATLTLKKAGDEVTGHFSRPDSDWKLEIRDGKVKGSTLTFDTVMERDDWSVTIHNTAVIAGKTMEGKSRGERDGQEWSREWKATKDE
jgi:hypothetical protein